MIECAFNRAMSYILLILGIVTHDWFCFALGALFLHLMTMEGLKGPKGDTGLEGVQGTPGQKGDRGSSFDEYHEYNNQFIKDE